MPISAAEALLDIAGLSSGYGKIGVLHSVNLTIGAGEVVALLGPNGAARPHCCARCRACCRGREACVSPVAISRDSPRDIVKSGLAHVVEGHRVFTQLAVLDNFLLAAYDLPRGGRTRASMRRSGCFPKSPPSATNAPPRSPAASSRYWRWRRVWCDGRASSCSRAFRRSIAGPGGSRAGGRAAAARGRHRGAAGRAVDRESAGARRSRRCAGARRDRAGSQNRRGRSAAPSGTRVSGDRARRLTPLSCGF